MTRAEEALFVGGNSISADETVGTYPLASGNLRTLDV